MLAVIKRPGEGPERAEIENTLRALQEIVGGYIETVSLTTSIVIVLNEEGRLNGMLPNCLGLVGPLAFVGNAGEEFRSLTEDEAQFLMKRL